MNDSMLLLDIGASAGELPDISPAPVRYGSWFPHPHQALPVPSVTGLTATPVADGILLEWDALDLPDVVYLIERATAEDGPWIELAHTTNTHYLVSDPSGDTWFFRVIPLLRGRAGEDAKVEGASKVIAGDADMADLIEKQKQIDESHIMDKAEWIDLNAEELVKEILRSNELNDIRRIHDNTINRAVTDISVLEENGEVTAQQVTDLFAQLDDETSTRQAQYLQVNTAIADETSARVSSDTQLHAQVVNASAALNQHINIVEANAASALASEKATLAAQIVSGDNATSTALHQRANQVEANAASARAAMQNTWAAQLANSQALLQSDINTKVTASQAQAIATTQLQAFQNGSYASFQQSFNTVAGQHNNMYGKWQASYSLKLTGGTFNGQPVVAGISLSANPNTGSDFIVQSDNFYVITQNASNGLELRNGYLRVFKGDTQRIIGNGFGSGGQLMDYFGPNVGPDNASKANAVMWMDTAGNAGFNGQVNAGNIVGQVQNAVTVYWTGNVDLIANKSNPNRWIPKPYFEPLTTFTLPAPANDGDSHRPMFFIEVVLNTVAFGVNLRIDRGTKAKDQYGNDLKDQYGNQVWIWHPYRERGNVFGVGLLNQESRMLTYPGENAAQLIHLGAPTTQSEHFRISACCKESALNAQGNRNAGETRVTSIHGFVVGIR